MTEAERVLSQELKDQWGLTDRLALRLVRDCPQAPLEVLRELGAWFLEQARLDLEKAPTEDLARAQGRVLGLRDFLVRFGRIVDKLDAERRK